MKTMVLSAHICGYTTQGVLSSVNSVPVENLLPPVVNEYVTNRLSSLLDQYVEANQDVDGGLF